MNVVSPRSPRETPPDLAVGEVVAERVYALTRNDLIRYAGASGDFNPIHWNQRIAASMGMPGVIGHGMLTMALAGRLLTDWLGDPGAVIEYGVRFSKPVVVPDDDVGIKVHVKATITAVRDDGVREITLEALVDDNKVLTRARALVRGSSS
ncbi:MaoC/PaaZ C-terminal domain-containing protein [Phytoactinopolyspora mesophila]|uniref:Dehydratase n=1 Tax=Phytoactinopolyspora mesophila TaxID=2650750 RepID=A0A7K3MB83_9ACTN|nr:MaoC/PaaZ C-terminal domain-containing protein [Phytoactinopolyspora mesophila]NDL60585.1 dehydratase [Phytoactinopolyspora mesophila]